MLGYLSKQTNRVFPTYELAFDDAMMHLAVLRYDVINFNKAKHDAILTIRCNPKKYIDCVSLYI